MKNALLLVLCLTILTASKCSQTAGEYFKRPKINQCITLSQPGMMACNGEIIEIPEGLIVPKAFNDFEKAEDYFSDKEERLYICLSTNGRRCD